MSNIPLTNTIEVVERSLYHAIRKEVVDKGYYPDTSAYISDAITAVTQAPKVFTIAGNRTAYYTAGRTFTVTLANAGTYTVVSSAFALGVTNITVVQAIPSLTVNGVTSIYKYYDDDAGVALLNTDIATIISVKGYCIEVFGVSSPAGKYQKKVPRIVIIKNQFMPGDLGGAPDRVYTPIGNDPLHPDSYTAKVQPPQTVNYNFDVHLVSESAEESRVLHGILALSIPKRGYVPLYNDDDVRFFVNQYSYRSIPDSEDDIDEDIYMYQAQDIFESEDVEVDTGIAPITEITIEEQGNSEDDVNPLQTFIIE